MNRRLDRRTFVKSSLLAGFGVPLLRTDGRAAVTERLSVACVGVGGKGWSDMVETARSPHVDVVAICDIDEGPQHLGRAAEKYPQATRYTDWRKLLDEQKTDAVIVSTPDHMHAPVAFSAMQRGRHVYCQKPLTHTVHEARTLARVAKESGVVTQMGNQIQAYAEYRSAVQLIHSGTIGKVKEVFSWQAGTPGWRLAADRPAGSDPVPAGVHWDSWLGVAPQRPFKKTIYHAFNWRHWQDFSNGQLGDFGCHILDPVFMALELTAPLSIEASAPPINTEVWTDSAQVRYVFPGTRRTAGKTIPVTWIDGPGHKPVTQLKGVIDASQLPGSGSVLVGEKGALLIPHVGQPKLLPEDRFADAEYPQLDRQSHYILWADACRGEGQTNSHFGYAGNLTETILLGTIAIRLPETKLTWDAPSMRLTGHPKAAGMLTRRYRRGWEIDGLS